MKILNSIILFGFIAICLAVNLRCQRIFSSSETIHVQFNEFNVVGESRKPKSEGPYPLVILVHGDGPAYGSYFPELKECMLDAGYVFFEILDSSGTVLDTQMENQATFDMTWDTTLPLYPNGVYTIRVTAESDAGEQTIDEVSVTVNNP